MKVSGKMWVLFWLVLTLSAMLIMGAMTAVIDPFFHFHKPLESLGYPELDPRYQNNGILRHADYDAVLIGSSMVENFKTSELDALFGVNSAKVPYFGAHYREINDELKLAFQYRDDIRLVVRCLDSSRILDSADKRRYEDDKYPDYLYDDNPFNDVCYLFNKDVFLNNTLEVLSYTRAGGKTENFDTYRSWRGEILRGEEVVRTSFEFKNKETYQYLFTEERQKNIRENVSQNITELALQHPETEFYLFFPPYSIYSWAAHYINNDLELRFQSEKYMIEQILPVKNIHLYSFNTEFDMICDLENYRDTQHYLEHVNSRILEWMANDEHLLTPENYEQYCHEIRDFYENYDYDGLIAGQGSNK